MVQSVGLWGELSLGFAKCMNKEYEGSKYLLKRYRYDWTLLAPTAFHLLSGTWSPRASLVDRRSHAVDWRSKQLKGLVNDQLQPDVSSTDMYIYIYI